MTLDPEVKCFLPGIPRATYQGYPFQIVQSPSNVLMAYEFANASRMIYMDRTEESPVDFWMGWSRGRWEGETLVVDVTGFNDQTWFDRAGNYHSDALRVVERYTATGPDHLWYEATIEDPKVFTSVENEHAALPPQRQESQAARVHLRRVRRRVDVRTFEEAAGQVTRLRKYRDLDPTGAVA